MVGPWLKEHRYPPGIVARLKKRGATLELALDRYSDVRLGDALERSDALSISRSPREILAPAGVSDNDSDTNKGPIVDIFEAHNQIGGILCKHRTATHGKPYNQADQHRAHVSS
jgi:hypothetical protein